MKILFHLSLSCLQKIWKFTTLDDLRFDFLHDQSNWASADFLRLHLVINVVVCVVRSRCRFQCMTGWLQTESLGAISNSNHMTDWRHAVTHGMIFSAEEETRVVRCVPGLQTTFRRECTYGMWHRKWSHRLILKWTPVCCGKTMRDWISSCWKHKLFVLQRQVLFIYIVFLFLVSPINTIHLMSPFTPCSVPVLLGSCRCWFDWIFSLLSL